MSDKPTLVPITQQADTTVKETLEKMAARAEEFTAVAVVVIHKDGSQHFHGSLMDLPQASLLFAMHQATLLRKFNLSDE